MKILKRRPTVRTYLDKRYKSADGTYSVKLIVTATWLRPRQKYYALENLTEKQWEQVQGNPRKRELVKIKEYLELQLLKAKNIVNDLNVFTYSAFENKFIEGMVSNILVYDLFERVIEETKKTKSLSSVRGYEATLSVFRKYTKNKPVYFIDIDARFIKDFIKFLDLRGLKPGGIRYYYRYLRAVFNVARDEGIVPKDHYPFESKSITIEKPAKNEIGIDSKQLKFIFQFSSESPVQQFARDMWVFSFLTSGANVTDIASFEYSNVNGDFLFFSRGKVSNKKSADIKIHLTGEGKRIIDRYSGNKLLFPILKPGMNKTEIDKAIKNKRRSINGALNLMCKQYNIEPFTIASARHTYATYMDKEGFSTDEIGSTMGHSKGSSITNAYIDTDLGKLKTISGALVELEKELL